MKGYRNEEIFGEGVTDPVKVALHETIELGNVDIPEYLIKHPDNIDDKAVSFLKDSLIYENFGERERDKDIFENIVKAYCGDRNYCKWLCESPEDVYYGYIGSISCMYGISFEEAIEAGLVSKDDFKEYNIPDDAIVLSDLGRDGKLWCWKKRD